MADDWASSLEAGMRIHAKYTDGEFYPAEVIAVSRSKKRGKAPVKVHYRGYGNDEDAWLGRDALKSKKIPAEKSKERGKGVGATPAQNTKALDLTAIEKGMKLQAKASDGMWYVAEVVAVSSKRKATPVKVNFLGYTSASDEWVGAAGLRSKALKEAPKPGKPRSGRFADPFWRKFDRAREGYVDSQGFMNRLPLRLEATNLVIHGLVDAEKLWKEFDDEAFQPVLVGGKAIITIFLNNFTDTDCGGAYLESWYNTVVTPKGTPQVQLEADKLPDGLGAGSSFLIRVVCSDAPGNPGAAMKAIAGGREIFGFPKHPNPGQIRFDYKDDNTRIEFDLEHDGQMGVEVRATLPGTKKEGEKYPVQEVEQLRVSINTNIPAEGIVSCPRLGGSHKGHNGAAQRRFAQHLCCTQHMAPWDPTTDTIKFGGDFHYGGPISRWDFVPALKAHIPDFKIAAFKPAGWISGAAADEAVLEHERKLAEGTLPGAL